MTYDDEPTILEILRARLAAFLRENGLPVAVTIARRNDPEYLDWQKTIVKIGLPELPFEQKLRLWDMFDDLVRDALGQHFGDDHHALERFSSRLFVDIEL